NCVRAFEFTGKNGNETPAKYSYEDPDAPPLSLRLLGDRCGASDMLERCGWTSAPVSPDRSGSIARRPGRRHRLRVERPWRRGGHGRQLEWHGPAVFISR